MKNIHFSNHSNFQLFYYGLSVVSQQLYCIVVHKKQVLRIKTMLGFLDY